MIIDFRQDSNIILSFSRGFVGFDFKDIDVKDLPTEDLQAMETQMKNAIVEINKEFKSRGH